METVSIRMRIYRNKTMEEKNWEKGPWTNQGLGISCKRFKNREVPPVSQVIRTGAPKGLGVN